MGTNIPGGITQQDWANLSPAAQAAAQADTTTATKIAILIRRDNGSTAIFEQINNQYANSNKGTAVEENPDSEPKTEDEQNWTRLDNLRKTAVNGANENSMNDKDLRQINKEDWQKYFKEYYAQNPDEAKRDIARIYYTDEVNEQKAILQEMLKPTAKTTEATSQYIVKEKYLLDYATTEDIQKYHNEIVRLKEYYTQHSDEAIEAWNELHNTFGYVQERDSQRQGVALNKDQMTQLIATKALDVIEINNDKLEEMAIDAIVQQETNHARSKVQDLSAQKAQLIAPYISGDSTEQARELNKARLTRDNQDKQIQNSFSKAEQNIDKQEQNKYIEDRKKLLDELKTAQMLHASQKVEALTRQINNLDAEYKKFMVQTELQHARKLQETRDADWEKAFKKAQDDIPQDVKDQIAKIDAQIAKAEKKAEPKNNNFVERHMDDLIQDMAQTQVNKQRAEIKFNKTEVKYDKLDKDIKEWIKSTPETFCSSVDANGSYNFTTTEYVLDNNKQRIIDNETGKYKTETKYWQFEQDKFKNFMLAASNDNEINDGNGNVVPSHNADVYADMQDRKVIQKRREGNEGATSPEKQKLKDRRFAKKCFKAAGIELEADRTFIQRTGKIVKGATLGGLVAGATTTATEYLNTLRDVSANYSGAVSGTASGTVTGSVLAMFQKVINISEDVPFEYSGTVNVVHEDYQNGILVGTYNKEIPYSGSGTTPFERTYIVSDAKQIAYSQDYNQDYTEGYSGTAIGNATMNIDAIHGAAIAGAVSGASVAAVQALKTSDQGRRDEAVKREILADKGVEKPKAKPEPPAIEINAEESTQEDFEDITTTTGGDVLTVTVKNTVKNTGTTDSQGRKIYEGYTWTSLFKAYKTTNGASIPREKFKEFVKTFREQVLENKTDIGTGEQHYPKSFKFDGVEYTFDTNSYKPTKYSVSNTYQGTSAKTSIKKSATQTTTTKTSKGWSGSVTATWTDAKGVQHTKTVTVSSCSSQEDAKTKLRAKITSEVPKGAKLTIKTKSSE